MPLPYHLMLHMSNNTVFVMLWWRRSARSARDNSLSHRLLANAIQAATFGQPSATVGGPYDYTRSGNPTRTLLEEQIAQLEVRFSCSLSLATR